MIRVNVYSHVNVNFNELVNKIINRNALKPYPDVNYKPN